MTLVKVCGGFPIVLLTSHPMAEGWSSVVSAQVILLSYQLVRLVCCPLLGGMMYVQPPPPPHHSPMVYIYIVPNSMVM